MSVSPSDWITELACGYACLENAYVSNQLLARWVQLLAREFDRSQLPLKTVTWMAMWNAMHGVIHYKTYTQLTEWGTAILKDSMQHVCELTCASKQRLTVAIGEWHQEEYKATNRSRPAGAESEPFIIPLKSANSGAVSSIKLSACSMYNYDRKWAIMDMAYFNLQQYFLICLHTLSMICTLTPLPY